MANFKRKPTNKEMANAIVEVNRKADECLNMNRSLDNVLGLYIHMKGDVEDFNKFLDEKVKERDESKRDGKTDKPDIPEDSKDKGAGTKRVRKKK